MKENPCNSIIRFKVNEQTKLLFQKNFEISQAKTFNQFLISLLDKNVALKEKTIENVDKETPGKKFSIRIKNKERVYLTNTFNSSTEKTLGSFVIKCVMNAPIKVENVIRMGESVSQELRHIGNNLNQIALKANQIGMVDKETLRLLNDIKKELAILTSRP